MRDDLAIVIPVGPGDRAWQGLLPQLAAAPAHEIAVVLARGHPGEPLPLQHERLLLAVAPAGRASQQNAGARATQAGWLWFLHADSRLAPATLPALAGFIARREAALGYFDLCFLDDGPRWMHFNTFGAALRSRWLGLPFGDQGLLLPRAVFERLGGFDESLDNGEDHALVWAARRQRVPLQRIGAPLYTSARKYAQQGWLRTTARHVGLTCRQALAFAATIGSRP